MKKLYRLIFISYIGSFVITFFIAVFVFLMIFIFVYIDDFVGKDIGTAPLLKLFFFFSLNTIPRALPLAILLSSIMAIGNMAEHFEITAMKSAGISFMKITRPLLLFSIAMSIFLFSFSNFMLPFINLKMETLLMSIRTSKPSLLFKAGVFNNELKGYSIRIGSIENEGSVFKDILIYDHSESKGNTTVLYAQNGEIEKMSDNGTLIFILNQGVSYKEMTDSAGVLESNNFIRDKFEQRTLRFNISDFTLHNVNENNFKDDYSMLNMSQINQFTDSIKKYRNSIIGHLVSQLQSSYQNVNDSLRQKTNTISKVEMIDTALSHIRESKKQAEEAEQRIEINEDIVLKYTLEWHKRITSALACIILFLIGAPMGYILKKGGLGMPIVASIILYITFYTLSIIGERIAEDSIIKPYQGIWLSTAVLLPLGFFLFYIAAKDATEFDNKFLTSVKKIIPGRKNK